MLAIQILISPVNVKACLWQGGNNAYWPTNSIKVCFTNLNDSERHQHVASLVKASIEEIDQKTRFRFSGYSECLEEERDEHQIRINLEDIGASGRSYTVGPSAGLLWPSTTLPLNGSTDPRTQALVTDGFISWTTKHELMHLLGLHHDHQRGSQNYDAINEQVPELVTFGSYDPNSIMLENESLSAGDLRCLNMIASRRMHLVYSGTQTTRYSDFDSSTDVSEEEGLYNIGAPSSIR